VSSLTIETTQNVQLDLAIAGLGERVLAFILDIVILGVYFYVARIFVNSLHIEGELAYYLIQLIFYGIPYSLYDFLFEVFNDGKTPGKMILKLQVLSTNGEAASMNQYLIRSLFRIIDMQGHLILLSLIMTVFGVDEQMSILITAWFFSGSPAFILVAATKQSQRLGDVLAGTVITKRRRTVSLKDTILLKTKKDYKPRYLNALKLSDKDVRLIKETLEYYNKSGDSKYIKKLAKKAKVFLDIQTDQKPLAFLKTLMKDYNHLAIIEDGGH